MKRGEVMVRVDLIRGKMAQMGFTQREAAEFIGVSQVTMCERMKTGKFWTTEIKSLAQLLEVEPGYFFAQK